LCSITCKRTSPSSAIIASSSPASIASIKYALEEVYELIEAIDAGDDDAIIAELGDVLLQVMLHSQIGEDNGYFTINDVIKSTTDKMIRRHPHVFGGAIFSSEEELKQAWEMIKQQEKGAASIEQCFFASIPKKDRKSVV